MKYKIPCYWEMSGMIEVEADTLMEAQRKAKEKAITSFLPEGYYIEDSFRLEYDSDLYVVGDDDDV